MSEYADQMNAHNRSDAQDAIARLRAVNFVDALGQTSVRTRRALLALSLIALVVSRYPIDVKQIPWLEIPAPIDSKALVPTLLLLAIVYHWVSFALYGIADSIKWEIAKESNVAGARYQMLYRLNEHIRRFEDAVSKIAPATDLRRWMEVQEPMVADARSVCESAIAEWNRFCTVSTAGFWLKRLTLWLWEVALPLIVAVVAGISLYLARVSL